MAKAVVIGSGISGIASSIRLTSQGYEVTVLEKAAFAGGKISEFRDSGFRFDMGPSLFTMPSYVEELFRISGETSKEYFRYKKLDIVSRYFYEDGLILDAYSNEDEIAEEFEKKTGEPDRHLRKFLSKSKKLYDLTADVFINSSLHDTSKYLSAPFRKALLGLPHLDPFRSMHQANSSSFKDPRLIQLFDRYATYNGSDPYQAPATLNVIPHLEHSIGAFFPEEGMYSIISSLVSLAKRKGVAFVFNEEVKKLDARAGQVAGVKTTDKYYPADVVVNSADVHHFFSSIKPEPGIVRKLNNHERSSSAMIFYWGMKGTFPQLELHNILFSANYREEFHHLFKLKELYQDPTVYIFISSKIVSGDAPEGCENWFVMVNAPENKGQDWEKVKDGTRKNVIRKIEKLTGINVESYILTERIIDPVNIEERTSSFRGSLYGTSSNSMFAAFRRHPNFSRKTRGLYFTGGSVHPGGGIPLCLASAKIVADLIEKREIKDQDRF